jgi:ferredoxin, 2Fe-2S
MITIHLQHTGPGGRVTGYEITGKHGESLMQAAVGAGVDGIAADCGGLLTCATCHVVVPEPWRSALPPVAAEENTMLDFTATTRCEGSRLSCQIVLSPALDGMMVELPRSQY